MTSDAPRYRDGLEHWTAKWEKNDIPFHRPSLHPYLKKNKDYLFDTDDKLKVFAPLCGKMYELKWFYDMGHRVIGVELVEQAIRDFFREQQLTMVEDVWPEAKSKVFTTNDGRLRIFCCDIFEFNSSWVGLMDVVWDRGTICTMPPCVRSRYAAHMKSLLSPGYKYILTTFTHEDAAHIGKPYSMVDSKVRELFGDNATLKKVDEIKDCLIMPNVNSPLTEVTYTMSG